MFFTKARASFSEAHKRPYNQDCCFSLCCDGQPNLTSKMSILCVLDGVSNCNGGEASVLAARTMRSILSRLLGYCDNLLEFDDDTREEKIHQNMREAILEADAELRRQQLPGLTYGTTVTLAVVFDEAVYTANVGDSPAYLLRINNLDGTIQQAESLFRCQNEAGEGVRTKSSNVLTQMLGGTGVIESKIHTASAWLGGEDLLLLGTDGALAVLTQTELIAHFNKHLRHGLQAALDELYQQIQNSASTDNATVLAEWLESN